jgi:hypothetical protein
VRSLAAPSLLFAFAAACAVAPYDPLVVAPERGLPADAFERCIAVLHGRFQRIVLADADAFRLQTDWVPGPDPDVASQQRATVFRQGDGVGCLVEARYLRLGWFDRLPAWSAPRPDPDLERELGEALAQALR